MMKEETVNEVLLFSFSGALLVLFCFLGCCKVILGSVRPLYVIEQPTLPVSTPAVEMSSILVVQPDTTVVLGIKSLNRPHQAANTQAQPME